MKPKTTPPSTVGARVMAARRAAGLAMTDLGRVCRVSWKTIQRIERGTHEPSLWTQSQLVRWARTLQPELGAPLLIALGEKPRATDGKPPSAATREADEREAAAPSPEVAARAVDDAVHALAERLDVGPRSLRRGLVEFLEAIEATKLPLATVRAQIAPRPPRDEETARRTR